MFNSYPLETFRQEFDELEHMHKHTKEENDAKEKEARKKAFDKAQRDRDNSTHESA